MTTASSFFHSFSSASFFLWVIDGQAVFVVRLNWKFLMDLVFLFDLWVFSLIFPIAKLLGLLGYYTGFPSRESDLVQISCSKRMQMEFGVECIMLA